ncbi:MAG TPA: hypothetical protein VGE08_14185 [Steroidobacter sp.]|uniref:hypothetical protein n=1 Tax=Steroidobacter sp. TaxID=1978227 RepID=UPI002ED9D7CF
MNAARHSRHLPEETLEDVSDEPPRSNRLRFELIFASLWLAFGLFVLPALIFWVGSSLLEAYGENAGLSTFYVDFFGDLADGSGRAWTLALGPLLLIYVLRAIFIGVKSAPAAQADGDDEIPSPVRRAPPKKEPAKRAPTRPARVEPRMGSD